DFRRHPLVSLLPEWNTFSTPTHRPSWRGANLDWSPKLSQAEFEKHVHGIADRLLAYTNNDINRWQNLIEAFELLPKDARDRVIVGLKAIDHSSLDEGGREKVVSSIRSKVVHHRSFPNASWALPEDILAELDSIRNQFEPIDPITRYSWLFVDSPRIPGETEE